MNFAMVEMKMAVCSMVQKFRFFPIKETPVRVVNLYFLEIATSNGLRHLFSVQSVRMNYVFKTDFS